MRSIVVFSTTLAATLAVAGAAGADPTYRRDVPANLATEAKITESAAVAMAHSAVPTGTVVALELELERKVLMYSIDMKVPGAAGVTEVEIDATSGKIIRSEHESASHEDEDKTKQDADDDEEDDDSPSR